MSEQENKKEQEPNKNLVTAGWVFAILPLLVLPRLMMIFGVTIAMINLHQGYKNAWWQALLCGITFMFGVIIGGTGAF